MAAVLQHLLRGLSEGEIRSPRIPTSVVLCTQNKKTDAAVVLQVRARSLPLLPTTKIDGGLEPGDLHPYDAIALAAHGWRGSG